MRSLLLLIGAGLALLGQGCSSTCEGVSDTPIAFLAGITDPTGTVYETSAWDAEYLSFPADRTYDLHHDLRSAPPVVTTYVGFDETPLEKGTVAESAGNIVVIGPVTDEFIRVHNDTCQHFYLRVSAFVAPAPPGGEGGAGGDGS